MEEDNAYPLNGQYFENPSRQRARDKEKAEVLQALPKLQEALDRWKQRLEAADSVRHSHEIAEKYNTSLNNALIAMDILRNEFEEEVNWMEALIDDNKR